jgi:hypothetical protein
MFPLTHGEFSVPLGAITRRRGSKSPRDRPTARRASNGSPQGPPTAPQTAGGIPAHPRGAIWRRRSPHRAVQAPRPPPPWPLCVRPPGPLAPPLPLPGPVVVPEELPGVVVPGPGVVPGVPPGVVVPPPAPVVPVPPPVVVPPLVFCPPPERLPGAPIPVPPVVPGLPVVDVLGLLPGGTTWLPAPVPVAGPTLDGRDAPPTTDRADDPEPATNPADLSPARNLPARDAAVRLGGTLSAAGDGTGARPVTLTGTVLTSAAGVIWRGVPLCVRVEAVAANATQKAAIGRTTPSTTRPFGTWRGRAIRNARRLAPTARSLTAEPASTLGTVLTQSLAGNHTERTGAPNLWPACDWSSGARPTRSAKPGPSTGRTVCRR